MKYTRIALLAVIPMLALSIFGVNLRPPAAHATVKSVITITKTNCVTLSGNVDWNGQDGITDADGAVGLSTCDTLNSEGSMRTLTRVLGGDEDNPKPEDFAAIDLDFGQTHQEDGIVFVIAFVGNDEGVGFYADNGFFEAGNGGAGSSEAICSSLPGADFGDFDCDENSNTEGDGVVAARWLSKLAGPAHENDPNPDRGPGEFRVRQGGIEQSADYLIVGEPDHITLKSLDPAVQTGAPACELFFDTPQFIAIDTEPETSPILATVTDSDGTAITGALISWSVDDDHLADLVIPAPLTEPLTPTVDAQALGLAAPEVLCGGDEAGTVKITAAITDGSDRLPQNLALDPGAPMRGGQPYKKASIEIPVQSPPKSMTLTGNPASIACDGVTSSTMSATLIDDEGNPVVNGNMVDWEVKALGSINPDNSRTADGAATTALTPLAGVTSGVVVRATWMRLELKNEPTPTPTPGETDIPVPFKPFHPTKLTFVPSDIEQTFLVSCEGNAASLPALPGAGQQPIISPPSTGSGGSSSNGSNSLVILPAIAAALLLAGAGLVARRRAA